MLLEWFLTTVAFLITILYVYYLHSFTYWRKRKVPQIDPTFPWGSSKIVNTGFNVGGVTADFYANFKERNLRFGGVYIGPCPRLLIVDLELIKRIFTKDFLYFSDRGNYFNEKHEPILAFLFNSRGKAWREMRRKLTPAFTTGRMRRMFEVMVECSKRMEESLLDGEMDVKVICSRFMVDSLVCCLFGVECDSFKDPDGVFRLVGKETFSLTLEIRIKRFLQAAAQEFSEFLRLKVISGKASDMFFKVMLDVIASKEAREMKQDDYLQRVMDMRGCGITTEQIVAEFFFFYLAAFESSAIPMQFCLYELAKDETMQEKVRREIIEVLGESGGNFTYEEAKEMKYLEQVINESLRKYPAVPTLTRRCQKNYLLPGSDVVVEKGTHILIPLYAIHNDERYYPNPEVFDPERFSDENRRKIPPCAFMPFGEGPRLCIGNRFALMQLKVGLCALLRSFHFKISPKTEHVELDKSAFLFITKSPIILECKRICC